MHGNTVTAPSDKSDKKQPQKFSNAGHTGRMIRALLVPCDGTMTQPMYTSADAGSLHGMLWRNGHTGMSQEPRVPSYKQLFTETLQDSREEELGDITWPVLYRKSDKNGPIWP